MQNSKTEKAQAFLNLSLMVFSVMILTSCLAGSSTVEGDLTQIPTLEELASVATGESTVVLTELPENATPLPELLPENIKLWPLPADAYFLDDSGRVWRQPRLGNESAQAVVSPDGLIATDFAVAPGGDWLAYRTPDAIKIADRLGKRVTTIAELGSVSNEFAGPSVAWSPSAGSIAFLTSSGFTIFQPGAGANGDPILSTVAEPDLNSLSWSPDSNWILVTRSNSTSALYRVDTLNKWVELGALNDHTWLSDGALVFAPAEGGLALLNPGNVNSRIFLIPQDRYVSKPVQRADGGLSFIVHSRADETFGYLYTADATTGSFSIAGNRPTEVASSTWDPSGQYLSELPNSREMLLSDPQTGAASKINLAFSARIQRWGDLPPETVEGLILPTDLFFLAPQAGVDQVWRLPASGDPPHLLTNSPENIEGFAVSQGRIQLIYSAGDNLWRSVINTLDLSQAESLYTGRPASASPAFSPTGRQVAYANRGIWVLDLETGESQQITADQQDPVRIYSDPIWSPDGEWILAGVSFAEGEDLVLLPPPDRPGRSITFLNRFGASAMWVNEITFFAYTSGAKYGSPYIDLFQTASPPISRRLYDLPVIGAEPRLDGRVVLLKIPVPGAGGPTVVDVLSVLPDGTDLRHEAGGFVLEHALISPDAGYIAGLIHTVKADSGTEVGQLIIVEIATGKTSIIKGVSGVHDLVWGR